MSASITVLRDDTTPAPAGLVWENPPAKRPTAGKYAAIAAALRERAGEWAILRAYPRGQQKRGWGFVGGIRTGKLIDFPAGEFEAQARTVDGECRVYVRAVPRQAADR